MDHHEEQGGGGDGGDLNKDEVNKVPVSAGGDSNNADLAPHNNNDIVNVPPEDEEMVVVDQDNAAANELNEKNQEEGPVLSPFDLPEVVSHFCEFLPVADLKNFRLLNKMINVEACQVLRKKQKRTFRSITDISNYSKTMNEGIIHFHETFVLTEMNLVKVTNRSDVDAMNEFLHQFGPRVKKCYISLNERLMLPYDWWTLLYNMPNLEELRVTISPSYQTPLDPSDFGCTRFEISSEEGGGRDANAPNPDDLPPMDIPPLELEVGNLLANRQRGLNLNAQRDLGEPYIRRLRQEVQAQRRQQIEFNAADVDGEDEIDDFEERLIRDINWHSDSDDEYDLAGGVGAGAYQNQRENPNPSAPFKRLRKPVLTQQQKNLYGTLVPKLVLSRLKRIHFTLIVTASTQISQATFNFIRIILDACHSSLSSIETNSFTTDAFLGRVILDCLMNSGFDFPRMEELNMWLKLTENDVVFLRRFSHLSNLKVVLSEGIRRSTFHDLISMCCVNLRELGLVIQNSQLRCSLDMNCYLPKLQTLKLLGYKGPLLFLRHMPALRFLDLYTVEARYLLEALINKDGEYNVQSLQELTAIKLASSGPPVGLFLGSVNSLSNLTRLELDNCNDDRMELVYKAMPNLKELVISGTFSDVGITGIARKNCEEILSQCAHFVVEDRLVRQFLYIGNLTRLKRLSLKSDHITDLSIMFGIAKLLKLRRLTIAGEQLTDIGVEVVKSYMILEYLNMSGCPNISEAALSKISDVWGCSIFEDEPSDRPSFRRLPNYNELMSFNHHEYLPLPQPFNQLDPRERAFERFARVRAELEDRHNRNLNQMNWPNQNLEERFRRRGMVLEEPDEDPDLDPIHRLQFGGFGQPGLARFRRRAHYRAREELQRNANDNAIDLAPGHVVNLGEELIVIEGEGAEERDLLDFLGALPIQRQVNEERMEEGRNNNEQQQEDMQRNIDEQNDWDIPGFFE